MLIGLGLSSQNTRRQNRVDQSVLGQAFGLLLQHFFFNTAARSSGLLPCRSFGRKYEIFRLGVIFVVVVTHESDSTKLTSLIRELIEALDESEGGWRHTVPPFWRSHGEPRSRLGESVAAADPETGYPSFRTYQIRTETVSQAAVAAMSTIHAL